MLLHSPGNLLTISLWVAFPMGGLMTRHFTTLALAAACAFAAAPATVAFAQDAPEEARTTYQITLLKFAPGADDRWNEMQTKYYGPAAKAAGLPETQVHWLMDGEWDIMLMRPMRRGLAAMDAHTSPERKAFEAAFEKIAGSEDAAKKLNAESDKLIAASARYYSHTHP